MSSRLLEGNAKKVDSVHFSWDVRVHRDALSGCAVFGRREGIEHLKRIAAADRAWNDAGNGLLGEGGGPVGLLRQASLIPLGTLDELPVIWRRSSAIMRGSLGR